MATALNFDKLYKLHPYTYKDYFGKMYISKKQMDERIALAEDIELVMLWVFAYWDLKDDLDISSQEIKDMTVSKLTEVYEKHVIIDPYIDKHIRDITDEIINTTEKNTSKDKDNDSNSGYKSDKVRYERFKEPAPKKPVLIDKADSYENRPKEPKGTKTKEPVPTSQSTGNEGSFINPDTGEQEQDSKTYGYWTSPDRAKIIAENEANSLKNYTEYREAKVTGKTKKKWLTENDEKVRLTHTLVEGKTVDIDGLFSVGGSLMRYPKDTLYDPDPQEIINCRCSCVYE